MKPTQYKAEKTIRDNGRTIGSECTKGLRSKSFAIPLVSGLEQVGRRNGLGGIGGRIRGQFKNSSVCAKGSVWVAGLRVTVEWNVSLILPLRIMGMGLESYARVTTLPVVRASSDPGCRL